MSEVVDTLKEVLDLLRNFPESQDLKELLDEINNTINGITYLKLFLSYYFIFRFPLTFWNKWTSI